MQIYFFTAGVDSDELNELESRIRSRLPVLRTLTKLEEVTKRLAEQAAAPGQEPAFIIFPVLTTATSFDRLVSIAEQTQRGTFFIFVSKEISASDYKRLVRSGGADWVSLKGAPQEVEDIIARASRTGAAPSAVAGKPTIAVFLPSSGGVGNTTLALETAVQFKLGKETRHRRVCLLDLDLQTSHVCDYLDIEPRLQMREIVETPERLDAQLFDLFVSHHSTGLDVLASPRGRQRPVELQMAALDALFGMIASRYDTLIIDLPPQWSAWTPQIVSVSNLAVVSGFNTVPGLRQIAETLQDVRGVAPAPLKIVVALNRCEFGMLGGVARTQHVQKILGQETILTVRDDTGAATHALNTGIPLAVGYPSSRITKDIRALRTILAEVTAQL